MPASSTPRRQRLRGRLGIDVGVQSPNSASSSSSPLPPIHSSESRTPLVQQQQREATRLRHKFHQRIETSKSLADLTPLLDAVVRAVDDHAKAIDTNDDENDCFTAAKSVIARIDSVGHAPYLSQFLMELVTNIERLAHDKRQHEAIHAAASMSPRRTSNNMEDNHEDDHDSSSSESESESSSDQGDDTEHTPATTQDAAQDLRHVPTRAKFRTTLRSRQFPPSRVPPAEYQSTTTAYMPFDHLKKPRDVASLKMRGHDEFGSAQWSLVVFPKAKPTVTNHDEVAAFLQWADTRHTKLKADHDKQPIPPEFEVAKTQFTEALALKELVCYELCRFLFDQCPTTARFVHGLFVELVSITNRTLANAERQQQIMEQRHRNVQLELTRLNDKRAKVDASLASLQETLTKRQHMILRERELIIRKRKKLSLLLCADQILIRRLAGLIHHSQDLADDIVSGTEVPSTGNAAPRLPHTDIKFTAVDDIVEVVLDKYNSLPTITNAPEKEAWLQIKSRRSAVAVRDPDSPDDEAKAPDTNRHLIVLDTSEVRTAVDEYKAILVRLSRMMSSKSPDSSIGWDPHELWDQALFIPPHEEVQDLERDVQGLCLHVEGRILEQRRRRAEEGSIRNHAVQTDISACMDSSNNPRWRQAMANRVVKKTPEPTMPKWRWRRLQKPRSRMVASDIQSVDGMATATVEEDHRDLLRTVVPEGFRAFIRLVPVDYTPHQLTLGQVHSIISYLFNGIWMLVQEDFHRPPKFSPTTPIAHSDSESRLIPLTTIHEYVYRIYLQHFHVESVVTSRLLDLLVSASRLDTQSCKIQLFCRLLGMPGVATFPADGFWFVLKALHILQRCCTSSGNYFLLDGQGDNEFVPQASATEAMSQLFVGSSNEVLKRLRLKLSGLASVFGAVWIPAYNVLTFIMDEWMIGQDALRAVVEEKLFVEHGSETDPFTGIRIFNSDTGTITFSEFLQGFSILQLQVNRTEAVQAYRQLVQDSVIPAASGKTTIDRHRFYTNWMEMILHAVNVAQQQMVRPQASTSSTSPGSLLGSSTTSASPGVQLGAIADSMVVANQDLAQRFLRTSWEQMKPEIIRRLDAKFNDVGLQVRLVQQMEAAMAIHDDHVHQSPQSRDPQHAWRSFQQLIHISFTTNVAAFASAQ